MSSHPQAPEPEAQPAGGTRARIQRVALDLFIEQGYEATSLREIAERLGVTKAALYYHYKSKDEIVLSLIGDQSAKLDVLIEWAQQQTNTLEFRQEFVRRYAATLYNGDSYNQFMRFMERNQTTAQKMHAAGSMREKLQSVQNILTPPAAPLALRLRRSMAIFALHSSWFALRGVDVTDDQRREAALEVAIELVE